MTVDFGRFGYDTLRSMSRSRLVCHCFAEAVPATAWEHCLPGGKQWHTSRALGRITNPSYGFVRDRKPSGSSSRTRPTMRSSIGGWTRSGRP